MKRTFAIALVLAPLVATPGLRAAVVVLANRTRAEVRFTLKPGRGESRQFTVPAFDVTAVPVSGPVWIAFGVGDRRRSQRLGPDRVYYFSEQSGRLNLRELGQGDGAPAGKPAPGGPPSELVRDPLLKIPVKVLVDEEDPRAERRWSAEVRKRVASASAIFERLCRVRFEVIDTGTWQSDNDLKDLGDLLRDFSAKADPGKARLAIGFTSQKFPATGPQHLGATRVPLQRHVLVREWFPRTEEERVEVLVHELGHFLGATHSPEPDSVMRPKLGDKQAVRAGFRVRFDGLNALVLNVVAQELRRGKAGGLHELRPDARKCLARVYGEIERAFPDDTLTGHYIRLLVRAGDDRPADPEGGAPPPDRPGDRAEAGGEAAEPESADPRVKNARTVIAAVVGAARRNRELPPRPREGGRGPWRRTGDDLTAYYFREAAAAAGRLPKDQAATAYLLGLAVALDTSDMLRTNLLTRDLWRSVESEAARAGRLKVLGKPTVHGRHDLAQHFVVSGALTALGGPRAAEAAGVLKEVLDSQGGSGFSFADLAADLSGIAFARRLIDAPGSLETLASSFTVADHALSPKGLPEGLMRKEFAKQYGSPSDKRFLEKKKDIEKRIQELPAYRKAARPSKE